MKGLGRKAHPVDDAEHALRRPWPCWAVGTAGPGSAGATTLAVALAARAGAVLIEADSDGGVLGARYGCWLNDGAPSLASLLAALHTQAGAASLEEHVQQLPSGSAVALLAQGAEQATGPVVALAQELPQVRAGFPDRPVVLDVGRLRSQDASLVLASQADAIVVVVQPYIENLGCLIARLPVLLERVPRLVIAVRGDGTYPVGAVQDAVYLHFGAEIPVLHIPEDRLGVAALAQPSRAGSPGSGGRSPGALTRSVDALIRVLPATAAPAFAPRGVNR